jgi:glycosyltransferase involved in cell wall biosynthesis
MAQSQIDFLAAAPDPRRSGADNTYSDILVSVVIPALNAARTIVRAIDSVRSQAIDALEIIVVDDGSVDDTIDVVADNIRVGEKIHLVEMKKNCGVSAARNAGIRLARGKFLAFLDADDTWLPSKLSKQIEAMEKDPAVTLVSCNSRFMSESGVPLKEGHLNRPPIEGTHAWKTLLIYNFLPTPTVLTYRALVREVGGFDESLPVGEDLDLWIKLALRGKVAVLKEVFTLYYDTPGSLMKRHYEKTRDIVLPMLEKHLSEQERLLSKSEVRHIRGHQSFEIGCIMYFSSNFLQCIPIFLKAAFYGSRPIKSISYIPRALLMEVMSRVKHRRY